jgi:hypothetical protein
MSLNAFSTPSWPFDAVSMTLKRASCSMFRFKAFRMKDESSTTNTRIGPAIPFSSAFGSGF